MVSFRLLLPLGCAALFAAAPPPEKKPELAIYDFNLPNIDGVMTAFAQYRGKVLLIVNVASDSALTPQYAQLESVYEKYKDQGLVVLAFPSNDFGAEEKEPEAKIKAFVDNTYHVTFPLFSKVPVRGDDATPLFHYLAKEGAGPLKGEPHWNFTKFIVDRGGVVSNRFEPSVAPDDPDVLVAVETALASKGSVAKPKSALPSEEAHDDAPRDRSPE